MLDILKNLDTNGKKEGFEYTIKIKNKKIVKELTLERNKRKQIQEDESRGKRKQGSDQTMTN